VFAMPAVAQPGMVITLGSTQTTGIIYAIGPQPASETALGMHTDARAVPVALGLMAQPQSLQQFSDSGAGFLDPAMRPVVVAIHAIVMFLTWFVLIPLSILFATPALRSRWFSSDMYSNPRYTLAHKISAGFALAMLVVGYATGYFLLATGAFPVHFWMGTLVAFLVLLQSAFGWWRSAVRPTNMPVRGDGKPAEGLSRAASRYHRSWSAKNRHNISSMHAWLGRIIWVLSVATIFTGFDAAGYEDVWLYFGGIMTAMGFLTIVYGPIKEWRK